MWIRKGLSNEFLQKNHAQFYICCMEEIKDTVSEEVIEKIREKYQKGELILIDKDLEWTSFDVVKKIRFTTRVKKVGHAGTLDPLATGLLIICTGKFTKKLNDYQGMDKVYSGSIKLGAQTPSFDRETDEFDIVDTASISIEDVKKKAALLTGWIKQVPPIYSAVKVDGVRAYKKARKGESAKLKERDVNILSFEIIKAKWPIVHFRIECSKGTYIRSLANDLGNLLGCGGYLYSLRRESIGDFSVKNALKIAEFVEEIDAQKRG